MLYKDFVAQAAIAALPAVINAYREKGEDVSWPTYDKKKDNEWQLPDSIGRACALYAERLAKALNDVEIELAGIRQAIEELTANV